ncbi:hypothetical protein LINGRAHAP2_LOCUS12393 [Linum grandiflorum]
MKMYTNSSLKKHIGVFISSESTQKAATNARTCRFEYADDHVQQPAETAPVVTPESTKKALGMESGFQFRETDEARKRYSNAKSSMQIIFAIYLVEASESSIDPFGFVFNLTTRMNQVGVYPQLLFMNNVTFFLNLI